MSPLSVPGGRTPLGSSFKIRSMPQRGRVAEADHAGMTLLNLPCVRLRGPMIAGEYKAFLSLPKRETPAGER